MPRTGPGATAVGQPHGDGSRPTADVDQRHAGFEITQYEAGMATCRALGHERDRRGARSRRVTGWLYDHCHSLGL